MFEIADLTRFLGWCTLINLVPYLALRITGS
jgi:hypothetical protein